MWKKLGMWVRCNEKVGEEIEWRGECGDLSGVVMRGERGWGGVVELVVWGL